MAGEGRLAASKLRDEFPGIRDEKNRLLALQSFQDCMYRYVDRFHTASAGVGRAEGAIINPKVSSERRREIVYLANELESFKEKMAQSISTLPADFYDKRDSTDKKPREDSRLIGLTDFSGYKAFQSASGGLDFSNATNNDLALLCDRYNSEISQYKAFTRLYKPLGLAPYEASSEARRICKSAATGR